MADQQPTLTPQRVAVNKLHHKLSSSSLSMSIPPDSPPLSHDFEPLAAPSTSAHRAPPPTSPLSATHADRSLNKPAQPVPFPSSVEGIPRASVLTEASGRLRTLSTRSTSSTSGGNAALAELARALGAQTNDSREHGPALDIEWLKTKERAELEALLAAADQVIRESREELHMVATVGKTLLEENIQLRSRHESLLSRTSPTKVRSSLGPASRNFPTIASASELRERNNLVSPALHKAWQQTPGSTSSGTQSSGAPRGRKSSDASSVPSAPTSPTSPKYGHLGVAGSNTARGRISSSSSIASLFAPLPRVHHPTSPNGEVQALSQANYALTLQLTELEADAERAEQEGKKRLRRLEKELQSLRTELSRVEERNGSLEDRVQSGASLARRRSDDIEQTPRIGERVQPKSAALAALGVINDFAPRAPITTIIESPGSPDTPTARSDGLKQSARRQPSLISAPDELVTQLMEKIDELQRENEAIETGRIEMEDRLDRAQDEVDQFKRKCEQLEDELEHNNNIGTHPWSGDSHRQPSITWRGEDDASPPARLKGNRREIERRASRRHNRVVSSVSAQSIGELSFTYSDKSIADTARTDSPTPGPRFGAHLKEHNGPRQGRTLESELGDGSAWGDDQSVVEHDDYDEEDDAEEDYADEHDEQRSYDDSLDYDEERSTIGTDETSTPGRKPTRSVSLSPLRTTLKPLLAPGSLRRSGPPDSTTYETISKGASCLRPVWADESEFADPNAKPARRGLRHTLLKSLDWAKESGPVDDDDEGEDLWDGSRYPEKDEHNFDRVDEAETRDRVARLGYGSLRSRSRQPQSKFKRIASGVPGFQDGDSPSGPRGFGRSMSRRDMALRRLGLEADEDEDEMADYSNDGGDHSQSDRESDEWSEEELGVGATRKQAADYYPVSLRARYAPKMMVNRAVDKAIEHLHTLITYVRFFLVLAMAIGFALYNGPDKMLGTDRQRKIRTR